MCHKTEWKAKVELNNNETNEQKNYHLKSKFCEQAAEEEEEGGCECRCFDFVFSVINTFGVGRRDIALCNCILHIAFYIHVGKYTMSEEVFIINFIYSGKSRWAAANGLMTLMVSVYFGFFVCRFCFYFLGIF